MPERTWLYRGGARGALAAAIGSCITLAGGPAQARVTQLNITTVETATFNGQSFGSVGTYDRIEGTFTAEVDPADFHNSVIVDIRNAPRNANGMVSYSADFQILKPHDLAQGNHRVLYELPNRGSTTALLTLNDSSTLNTRTSSGSAGNGFLMNQGYTLVEVGWDISAPQSNTANLFGITVPVASNPDGSPITGPATEELVVDFSATPASQTLTYPAAGADAANGMMTVRENYEDTPIPVPAAADAAAGQIGWTYIDSLHVGLVKDGQPINFGAAGTFSPTALYEFTYTAQDPLVAGLGLASIRDFATFLRSADTDDLGNANPLAGDVQKIYTFCLSQPCRTTHDFILWGFNAADTPSPNVVFGAIRPGGPSERVFDGMENWLGGGNGEFLNYRFSQPTRTHRQHIARWTPEFQFPFANQLTADPVTHQVDGRLARCQANNTCPNIFEVNSENEYISKAGSMLTTDGLGHDLDLNATANVRYYLLASLQHGGGPGGTTSLLPSTTTSAGICRENSNPMVGNVILRALLVDLDDWVTKGTAPPPNAVPTIAGGTLVPQDQASVGFPSIPGVTYNNGILHTGDLWNFGPHFAQGILTTLPPTLLGTPYQVFVPKTDADGNDIAGIRLPDVSVPLATYTGWGLRAPHGGDADTIVDSCDATGQKIPFAPTAAARRPGGANAGDPRLSIAERYPDSAAYVAAITAAAASMVANRTMLPADATAYAAEAAQVTIP
jgi:hypothetical protein